MNGLIISDNTINKGKGQEMVKTGVWWLSNALSKRLQFWGAAIPLRFLHYDFTRPHQNLQVTLAIEEEISQLLFISPDDFERVIKIQKDESNT